MIFKIEAQPDSDFLVFEDFSDIDYNMEQDDRLFEKFVDPDVQFGRAGNGELVEKSEMYDRFEAEHDEEVEDSDDFDSLRGFDEELNPKYP